MTDVYKIGVTVALTNLASAELIKIADLFGIADKRALALNASMKLLAVSGIAAFGFAVAGAIKSSNEYAHQLNILNMAGLSQVDVSKAVAAAWQNSSKVMTTTATDNLKVLLDLRNVLGSMPEAMGMLETVTKIQAVMSSSSEGKIKDNADSIAFGMAKALDTIGAATGPKMQREAEMMSKVVTAFQGRVQPNQFQSVFTYARQAKFDLSDEFKYEILPSLMLEMANGSHGAGGGSRGVGPMLAAMYRFTNQGYINKKALPELQALGLVDSSTALNTTTTGTTVGAMKDAALAASNPFLWVNQVLVPAIRSKYGSDLSDAAIREHINGIMRGNQLAASMSVEFFTKQQNFLRDQGIIRGAMGYQEAYGAAEKNDPYMALKEMGAQWENVKIAFGNNFQPIVVPTLKFIADVFNYLGAVFRGMHDFFVPLYDKAVAMGNMLGIGSTIAASGLSAPLKLMGGGSAVPPASQGVTTPVTVNMHIDGEVVARKTANVFLNGMGSAPSTGNDYDLRSSPLMPGYAAARGF